jgi:glycosyltransferase involved in cell wall biosynthesis
MHVLQIMMNADFGGAERAFLDTCLSLAEQGVRVSAVIDPKFVRAADLAGHPNIAVFGVRHFARWDPLAKRRIYALASELRPDVAHVHLRKAMALSQGPLAAARVPIVASMHNYGRADKYAAAKRMIALSPGHAHYLIEQGRDPASIDVIPNFSRLAPGTSARPSNRRTVNILSYGRFVPKKGFDVLIEAFAVALRTCDGLSLTIAGRGPEEPRLRQLVDSLQLQDCCKIQGWSDDPAALLDQHDLFVLPSRSEPFGIVALEAMARAKPIVSTDTEGPAQYLQPDFSILCKRDDVGSLADAIVAACSDRDRLDRLARSALNEFMLRYRHDVVIGAVIESYARAKQTPSPRAATSFA